MISYRFCLSIAIIYSLIMSIFIIILLSKVENGFYDENKYFLDYI